MGTEFGPNTMIIMIGGHRFIPDDSIKLIIKPKNIFRTFFYKIKRLFRKRKYTLKCTLVYKRRKND
jgi:hypothetical protein